MIKINWNNNVNWFLRQAFAFSSILFFIFVATLIIYTMKTSELWDLNVFYSASQNVLHGKNIYQLYGSLNLPYWYFPWVSWLFIPLALFPFNTARIIYAILTICSTIFIQLAILNNLSIKFNLYFHSLFLSTSILMCWLLFHVGQIDYLLAVVVIAIILLVEKKQNFLAGLLFPLLLVKPHLLALFIPYTFLRGGKKYFLAVILSLLFVFTLSFIIFPSWPTDMVNILHASGGRTDNYWDFTTFSELIGLQENWSGTNNLALFFIQCILGSVIIWKNQHLPTTPFLALTLTASLFCAPRAYSYNYPLLIPSLLWLSDDKPLKVFMLWLSIGIISWAGQFSTPSYLIVLMVLILSIVKSNHFSCKNFSQFFSHR